jgi:hypothetical protein
MVVAKRGEKGRMRRKRENNTMGFAPISLQTELKTLTNVGIHSRLRQVLLLCKYKKTP